MEVSRERIQELIPHRYPFLFIDGVTAYEPGRLIEGFKLVSFDEPFFQGHFPGRPIMPGVLIVEALAQLGCIFLALELGEDAKDRTPLFLGIDKARFRALIEPGMRLEMALEVLALRRGHAKVKAVAKANGAVAAQGELAFMLR
jgi:3-hydroxyacyl-[acyl-carrier-protein] dehydratase